MPFMVGSTTVMATAAAMAASTALPPLASMRRPAVAARCCEEATTLAAKIGNLLEPWGKSYAKDGTGTVLSILLCCFFDLLFLCRRQRLDARHETGRLEELTVIGLAFTEHPGHVEQPATGDLAQAAAEKDPVAKAKGF